MFFGEFCYLARRVADVAECPGPGGTRYHAVGEFTVFDSVVAEDTLLRNTRSPDIIVHGVAVPCAVWRYRTCSLGKFLTRSGSLRYNRVRITEKYMRIPARLIEAYNTPLTDLYFLLAVGARVLALAAADTTSVVVHGYAVRSFEHRFGCYRADIHAFGIGAMIT